MGIETYPICDISAAQCRSVTARRNPRSHVWTRYCVLKKSRLNYEDEKEKTPSFWPGYSVLLCEEKPYAAIPDMVLILVQDLSGIA